MKKSRTLGALFACLLSLIAACGDDGPSGPVDLTPAPITDLAVVDATETTVALSWTAPREVAKTGEVVTYDVRYASDSLTVAIWTDATQVEGEPTPSSPDSAETYTVTGLLPSTRYWFAVRSVNEEERISATSNIVSTETDSPEPPTPVPAAVTDLAVAAVDDSAVTLTWTTPGEITKIGALVSYDLRYGPDSLTEASWGTAVAVTGEPSPAAPETPDTFEVTGLERGTQYWFALRSTNDLAEISGISNSVAAETDSLDDRLIAYYPLIDDSVDVTGHYGPITLVNAPFEGRGVLCSGVYAYSGLPGACNVETPYLDSLDFGAFTISCHFRVTEIVAPRNWVVNGGFSWRWMGCTVEGDTTIALFFNNDQLVFSDVECELGVWHEVTLVYEGAADLGELYLDGTFVVSQSFVIEHGDDRSITVNNGGVGKCFKGTFGGLRIYDGIVRP